MGIFDEFRYVSVLELVAQYLREHYNSKCIKQSIYKLCSCLEC